MMEELIKKAKNGEKNAFLNLMLLYEKDLYKIAKLRLKNYDDICDAVQETILIAYKSIKKLKHPQYFKTWIIKILINETNHIYRQNSKRKIVSFEEIENIDAISTLSNSNIENVEELIDFNFICKNLKYEDRVIIALYYIENFTDKEIGKILKLKEKTVTTKRTRAKQKIKNIVEKGGKI